MAGPMAAMSCVQTCQQGASYIMLVPYCFASPQPQQPYIQYVQLPQSFQAEQGQHNIAQQEQSLRAPLQTQQDQQTDVQYFQMQQPFHALQGQQELLPQHRPSCHYLQEKLAQLGRSDSITVSTQFGDGSHGGSATSCMDTPPAGDPTPARYSPCEPTRCREVATACPQQQASAPDVQTASAGRLQGVQVPGSVMRLSCSKEGSHLVQEAFESAQTDEAWASLAEELHGHVVRASKCANANRVLQKCIATGSPQSLQFVVNELRAMGPRVRRIAKHRYGCRIFQRLLEHCSQAQLQPLAEIIIADALTLAMHLYASHVVQGIIEHGTKDQRQRLVARLSKHADVMGADIHGGATLNVALLHTEESDRLQIARRLLRQPGMLVSMARSRRGHPAVICVLDALEGQREARVAINELMVEIDSLRACRYGKVVAAHLTSMVDMTGHA